MCPSRRADHPLLANRLGTVNTVSSAGSQCGTSSHCGGVETRASGSVARRAVVLSRHSAIKAWRDVRASTSGSEQYRTDASTLSVVAGVKSLLPIIAAGLPPQLQRSGFREASDLIMLRFMRSVCDTRDTGP